MTAPSALSSDPTHACATRHTSRRRDSIEVEPGAKSGDEAEDEADDNDDDMTEERGDGSNMVVWTDGAEDKVL